MNRFRIISLFIALSLLPPGNMPLPLEAATPTVTTDPAIITPGDAFSTRATGFAPDSTLNIFYEDQTEGAARHIIEGYFGETSKKTDETGTADFPGSAAVYDGGTTSFTFKDEAGNTAVGTVRVEGRAPRPFLFGPKVEVTEENIQIGFFGVGWTAGKEKSIRAFTPSDEAWTPQVFDLCENAACPEREDGLKLIAVLPRSLVPGTHRFIVSEQGTAEEVSTFAIIPELKENKAALMKEAFLFVQPQTASQYTEYLLIRGSGWGRYDDRGEPTVLLMPDNDTAQDIPLTLERNYRDCSFVVGEKIQGKCTMDEGDMFMRAPLPKNLKEGAYTVYVTTQNYFDGAAELRVVRLPDFSNAKRPIIAIQPTSGPVGTNVLLSAGGFPKRTGLFIRFDGAKQPGILYTDTNGAVGEYAFTIPSTISKDFKVTTIKPGKHTIEVTDGAGLFQTVTFTVTEKEEEPKKEEPKKEEPKKEEPKKEVVEDPSKRFIGKPCDPVLPRSWQQGCIDETAQKETPAIKYYVPDSSGKQCRDDIAITFQPGCVPVIQPEAVNRFIGQTCDPILPRSWQQGCIDPKEKQLNEKPAVQYYAPDSVGKQCRDDIAITFQPGCVPVKKPEPVDRFAGKPCDPILPRSWQQGCIPPASEAQQQKTTTPAKSAAQSSATTQKQTAPKCNPQVPHYSQPGCVD